METNTTIDGLITLMQLLISTGAAARCVYCLIAMQLSEEESPNFQTRIRNTLVFAAASVCITGLIRLAAGYF